MAKKKTEKKLPEPVPQTVPQTVKMTADAMLAQFEGFSRSIHEVVRNNIVGVP